MHRFEQLLMDLAEKVGCRRLSELNRKQYTRALTDAVRSVSPESYTLEQWNEAAYYLTKVPVQYAFAEEARMSLLRALNSRF